MSLLIRKTWTVFIYAITISVESILIEFLTSTFQQITPIVLSAISITFAGVMLLAVASLIKGKGVYVLFIKRWKSLILASFSLAAGIFTWYDAISRIGASKEVLIAGPLEIVIIVILAQIFLNEKLYKIQVIGIVLALIGFFMAVASGVPSTTNIFDDGSIQRAVISVSASTMVNFGNIEAILSAVGFAIGVLFLTRLVSVHSSIEVAGATMLISGLILVVVMIGVLHIFIETPSSIGSFSAPWQQKSSTTIIIILILFSTLPFTGSLCYSTALSRIGASITSTIGSSSILITILLQIILKELGITSNLPENIFLAILGGILGFIGIYVIHMDNGHIPIGIRKKQ